MDKSLKILLVANSAHIGGGNTSICLLARGLQKAGHQPTVVVPGQGAFKDLLEGFQIATRNLGCFDRRRLTPIANRRWDRAASRMMAETDCDLVHTNGLPRAQQFAWASKKQEVPLICHVRFPFSQTFAAWKLSAGRCPDWFVYNSRALKDEVHGYVANLVPDSPSSVVHNAVDLSDYPAHRNAAGEPKIAVVANFQPIKGHPSLFYALRLLADEGVCPRVLLIGDDVQGSDGGAQLRKLQSDLSLENVHFLGFRSDVPKLLQECSMLVCPSLVETFGRCLIEGMASRLPVIGTRVGGIPEVLDQGKAGILVPPDSPRELAAQMKKLLTSPDLCEQLGAIGRRRVEQQFSVSAHTENILSVYGQVLRSYSC